MNQPMKEQKSSSTIGGGQKTVGRLLFLEASGGRIHAANADGSNGKVIVTGCRIPDEIVVDVEAGHIY